MDKSEFVEKLSKLEFDLSWLRNDAELLSLYEVVESLNHAHRYLSEAVTRLGDAIAESITRKE